MACRRSFTSRHKSILRFRQKLKKPNAYLDIAKGRVKRITQPVFVPNKRECRELVNLKRAFPPLKRSISYVPRHQPPQTSFKFCQIL